MMRRQKSAEKRSVFLASSFAIHHSQFIIPLFLSSLSWSQPALDASSINAGGTSQAVGGMGASYEIQASLGQSGVIDFSQWAGGVQSVSWGLLTPEDVAASAPVIVSATISDVNNNGIIEPGDELVLTLDRSVIVEETMLQASHFFLPVLGDTLGKDNFAVQVNPYNSRQIRLILGGPTVHLVTSGTFSMAKRAPGAPSGIDFATSLPLGSIRGLDGIAVTDGGQPGVDDSGVDIELSLVKRSANIGSSGGTIAVVNSPEAAYRRHAIDFPVGAVPTMTTFELRPPVENQGVIDAVQVASSNPTATFAREVTLRLEYRQGDIDWQRGQIEGEMCVQQLVLNAQGVLEYVPVPGVRTLDTSANLVTVRITGLNPCGSRGTVGIFAGIPIETVDERVFNIKHGGGMGVVRGAGSVIIAPGPKSAYPLHKIEIPNYVETTTTDPLRLVVKLRSARLIEREASLGGHCFPTFSGAIFVVAITDATSRPVMFTDPYHLTVQYKERGDLTQTDVVHMDGQVAAPENMRLVCDRLMGEAVDFVFMNLPSQQVNVAAETVSAQNAQTDVPLTDACGIGVFGAAAWKAATPAGRWHLYP